MGAFPVPFNNGHLSLLPLLAWYFISPMRIFTFAGTGESNWVIMITLVVVTADKGIYISLGLINDGAAVGGLRHNRQGSIGYG